MLVTAEHPYQAVLMRDLKAQVQRTLRTEEVKRDSAGGDDTTGGRAVYEVYTRTEATKFSHLSKVRGEGDGEVGVVFYLSCDLQLSEVERRLAQLEALVGSKEMAIVSCCFASH